MACFGVEEASGHRPKCCSTLVSIRRWAVSRHNKFYNSGCHTGRTTKGSTRVGTHGVGRALDIGIKSHRTTEYNEAMWIVVNGLVDQHCNLGIQRIYFDRHRWDVSMGVVVGPTGWTALTTAELKKSTYRDHAHIEITTEKCDTFTYEDIVRLFPHMSIPGGNNEGITPPNDLNDGTPSTGADLTLLDTSGQWSRESMIAVGSSVIGSTDLENIETHMICGARGGYVVNMETGLVLPLGLGINQWLTDFGGPLKSFVPWEHGYIVLLNDGVTIQSQGATAVFDCGDDGPWDSMQAVAVARRGGGGSATSSGLVLVRTDADLNIIQCAGTGYGDQYPIEVCCADTAWTS